MKRKKWILYLASVLLSVLLFVIGRENITRFIEGAPAQKVSVSELQAYLKEVKIHDGDRWVDGPTSFDKNSLVVLKGYLHSALSPSEIVQFYKESIPSQGWTESEIVPSGNDEGAKFCRNGVSLIVESGDEDRGNYYFRLAWATNEKSDSYCPGRKVDRIDSNTVKR